MVVAQYSERQLPYDHEAEAAVLGALLIDGDALLRVTPVIKPEDFHRARNHFCFAACLAVFGRQEAVDQITVARELQRQDRLEQVGGLAYLGQLISGTPTSVNVEHYAGIVADTAAKRRLIDAGNRIAELGFEDNQDADDTMRQAVEVLFRVQPTNNDRGFVPLSSVLDVYLEGDIGDVSLTDEPPLQSGYGDLDSLLGGMQRSDLLIVGARPGLGKKQPGPEHLRQRGQSGGGVRHLQSGNEPRTDRHADAGGRVRRGFAPAAAGAAVRERAKRHLRRGGSTVGPAHFH